MLANAYYLCLSLVSPKSKALSHAVTLITGYDLNAKVPQVSSSCSV